jgi:hypothetical protein
MLLLLEPRWKALVFVVDINFKRGCAREMIVVAAGNYGT